MISLGFGKTLCLNPGIYTTNNRIYLKHAQRLAGTGMREDVVIISSANTVFETNDGNWINHLTITAAANTTPSYGILIQWDQDVHIWNVAIAGMGRSIWIENSKDIFLATNHLSDNGWPNTPVHSQADPHVYIANSENILMRWGKIEGQDNPPHGDGEIACYSSNNVTIYGVRVIRSGTSAIYFVNCDNSTVENTTLKYSGGWGLDIVGGSDNFTATNNTIKFSRHGGSVFREDIQTGGIYIGNTFRSNNTGGYAGCNGINITGDPSAMVISDNTATPGPVACGWRN